MYIRGLGTDRDDFARLAVAFLALIFVRHRIWDAVHSAVGRLEGHGHAPPGDRQRRILAVGIPDIGQRGPAVRAVEEQARLARAPAILPVPAEAFDDRSEVRMGGEVGVITCKFW